MRRRDFLHYGDDVKIIDTKPFYTLEEQRGRDSMKADILKVIASCLVRDPTLQKLAKAIEGMK